MTPKDWSTWITIGVLAAGGVARIVSLEEAKTIAQRTAADHEARIRAMELDRGTATELNALKVEVTELKGEVRALRDALAAEPRRRR